MECKRRVMGLEGKSCRYSRLESTYREMAPKISSNVMDLEELVEYGQYNKICPFYYSRRVKDMMDLLFIPYNYLLDRNLARMYDINCHNAILIFDEGHNVPTCSR